MIIYYTYDYTEDRKESRRLLRLALTGYTGSEAAADELMSSLTTFGTAGKPCVPGFDGFSVSHSGNAWAVLFCCGECGLDIQFPRNARVSEIASRFYADDDAESVRSAGAKSDREKEAAFFRIWTRREALVKAMGISVASDQLPSVGSDHVEAAGREYTIRDIDLPDNPGLYAAVCIGDGENSGSIEQLQFRELKRD